MKEVYLKVHSDGRIAFIGSWQPAKNELINNYQNQSDLGWHIFLSFWKGADRVEVCFGDQNADYQDYQKNRKEQKK